MPAPRRVLQREDRCRNLVPVRKTVADIPGPRDRRRTVCRGLSRSMSNSLATHRVRLEGDAIGEHGFQCSHGDNLLRAGLRAGVGFPYECNSGGCGNCQFEVREGTVEDIWPAAPGLAPRARARG